MDNGAAKRVTVVSHQHPTPTRGKMVKIALAAALTVIVMADVTVGPFAPSATVTNDRPRGLKGDRLPMLAPNPGCAEKGRPFGKDECDSTREERPAILNPASRLAANSEGTSAGAIFRSALS
jgi:hypothetical protein